MRKIVYINLQDNDFIFRTFIQTILKRGSATKHRFYLDYLLNLPDVEVCNYIVANKKRNFLIRFLLKTFKTFEHYFCINHENIKKKIKILYNLDDISGEDIIMYYSHYPSSLDFGAETDAKKVVCITHSFGTLEEAERIKKVFPEVLWGDGRYYEYSDLYKKNFEWFSGKYVESTFVPEDRFQLKKSFNLRYNKAFATGTVTNCYKEEFLEYYGNSCYQPLRKQILDNESDLESLIFSKISNRDEQALKKPHGNSRIEKIYCYLYNEITGYKQKNYYSFNMVDAFNEYKMCIVPEDINGVPGVGFVEGMACGCAYIGYERIDYSQYELIPNIDYITYDGSIEDLMRVINYYQIHETELKIIAENGYTKIKNNTTKERTAKRLFDKLF